VALRAIKHSIPKGEVWGYQLNDPMLRDFDSHITIPHSAVTYRSPALLQLASGSSILAYIPVWSVY